MLKPENKKNIFPKFGDDIDKRSKNVVLKNLSRIIEEEYPKLYEEVEYMIEEIL